MSKLARVDKILSNIGYGSRKEKADYITKSNDEDGIVQVIDKFFSTNEVRTSYLIRSGSHSEN